MSGVTISGTYSISQTLTAGDSNPVYLTPAANILSVIDTALTSNVAG